MLKLYSTSLPLKSITKKYELKLKKAHKILNASKARAFLNLPKQDAKEITKQTTTLLKKFEDIVIVGMGGSILGSQMLFKTLKPRFYNFLNDTIKKKATRIHFIDTLDPHLLLSYGDILNKKHTLFIFISKSGDTLETSSLFELINKGATEWFGKNFREHLLIMTENKEGHLYKEAIKNKLNIIPLPKNIGGRYSVLTEAGLIPATFMNIDIKSLLKGAQNTSQVDTLASTIYHMYKAKDKKTLVFFPYVSGLEYFNKWAIQLIAESLGKNQKTGPLPVSLLGPSDQHSVLQLLLDGPKDKWVIFFELEKYNYDYKITNNSKPITFSQILKAEKIGTSKAMDQKKVPNITISLENLKEESVGQLIQTFLEAVAIAGIMLDINPFNQPAVELGKKQTTALIKRQTK